MGIKDLYTFLKDAAKGKSANAFREVPLELFSGKRVAIDAYGWAFVYFQPQWKKIVMAASNPIDEEIDMTPAWIETKKIWITFNIDLMKHGITPLWLFDGEAIPEKEACRLERYEESNKKKEKIGVKRNELQAINPLLRQPQAVLEYKMKLSQNIPLRGNHIMELKEQADALGIPNMIAPHEAEIYASHLVIEGLAVAVWSRDADCQAVGAPISIQSFEHYNGKKLANIVVMADILQGTQLSQDVFRDLCIMCGCDFNKRIYMVGPAKAYAALKKYGSIEAYLLNTPKKDGSCLNQVKCRELLSHVPTGLQHDNASLNLDHVKFSITGLSMLKSIQHESSYSELNIMIANTQSPTIADFSSFVIPQPENSILPAASASSSSSSIILKPVMQYGNFPNYNPETLKAPSLPASMAGFVFEKPHLVFV